jgi:tetratricopeptide (TPR) repeat protein
MFSRPEGPLILALLLASGMVSSVCAQARPGDSIEQYFKQGQTAIAEGKYGEAEAAFEKLREVDPGAAEVYGNLGLVYFQEKKFEQAVPTLRQALKLKPGLPQADVILALSLAELGRYQEALPGLEKGFHLSRDSSTRRLCGLQLERTYMGLQQDRKAVAIALDLNKAYPDDPEILYHSGKVYGNFAFLAMQRLAQVAPASIWRHQAEAEAYESQGAYDTAIGEYRQVLAIDPGRPGIHYRIGRTLQARSRQTASADDVELALKEFEQELQLDPANASAAYEIAEMDRNSGQLEAAQKFFQLALQHDANFEEAHLGLAAVLTSLQKPASALPHLERAIRLNREDPVAWYRLAQVQGLLGHAPDQQKALAEFERLHQKSSQQKSENGMFSPAEVTRQELDGQAPK